MLSDETQRRALPRYQSEEMKISHIWDLTVGIGPTTCPVSIARLYEFVTLALNIR